MVLNRFAIDHRHIILYYAWEICKAVVLSHCIWRINSPMKATIEGSVFKYLAWCSLFLITVTEWGDQHLCMKRVNNYFTIRYSNFKFISQPMCLFVTFTSRKYHFGWRRVKITLMWPILRGAQLPSCQQLSPLHWTS